MPGRGIAAETSPTGVAQNTRPSCFARWRGRARSLTQEVLAIYFAARDPRTPWYAKALAFCVAGYALSPIDLIPDFVPVIGYLDDLVIVPLGMLAVLRLIPEEVMAEYRARAIEAGQRPRSKTAAIVIVAIWILAIGLTAWFAYHYFTG